jgi:ArsR family transcriptional regulator, arsenate/arsenite/antimonite-responsive transcriptional repressor
MTSTATPLSDDRAALMLSALGSASRLRIYRILLRAGVLGLSLTGLQQASGMPLSTLNHHVQTLVGAGLIAQTRFGRELMCTAAFTDIRLLSAFLLQECCAGVDECAHESPNPSVEDEAVAA